MAERGEAVLEYEDGERKDRGTAVSVPVPSSNAASPAAAVRQCGRVRRRGGVRRGGTGGEARRRGGARPLLVLPRPHGRKPPPRRPKSGVAAAGQPILAAARRHPQHQVCTITNPNLHRLSSFPLLFVSLFMGGWVRIQASYNQERIDTLLLRIN